MLTIGKRDGQVERNFQEGTWVPLGTLRLSCDDQAEYSKGEKAAMYTLFVYLNPIFGFGEIKTSTLWFPWALWPPDYSSSSSALLRISDAFPSTLNPSFDFRKDLATLWMAE